MGPGRATKTHQDHVSFRIRPSRKNTPLLQKYAPVVYTGSDTSSQTQVFSSRSALLLWFDPCSAWEPNG